MAQDDFSYILGNETPISTASHPPTKFIHHLWQTFLENVNPLTKLVHVPNLEPVIQKGIANVHRIPNDLNALMFAIYSVAVLSLTEAECKEDLGEMRAVLLVRYVAATKEALSRAKFMSSTSIIALQALVLHILSIRDAYEARAVWTLTGLALRIAQNMGLHIDGTLLGLSPFETEIRRRVWWQLKMHDFRAAELSGQAKFRDFELDPTAPKRPTNVNDDELYPSMTQFPTESLKPTEMIWCALRSDLASFAAAQKAKLQKPGKSWLTSDEYSAMDDLKIKDGFIKEMEDMIEAKYLRFCDPSQPLQLHVLLGARCSTNLVRFVAHHPRRWAHLDRVPPSEKQFVWGIVVHLLEQYNMMQSNPQLRRFAWNVPYFIQWHAIIHILDTLRVDPIHPDATKVWLLINEFYENNSATLLNSEKPIFVAVGNLCLKAYSARAAALAKGECLTEPPDYIMKLQKQRRLVKTGKRNEVRETGGGSYPTTMPDDSNDINPSSTHIPFEQSLQQQPAAKPAVLPNIETNTRTENDVFWTSNATDDSADKMNLDIDALLSQDFDQMIDWAQWDALMGNVQAVGPNMGTGRM